MADEMGILRSRAGASRTYMISAAFTRTRRVTSAGSTQDFWFASRARTVARPGWNAPLDGDIATEKPTLASLQVRAGKVAEPCTRVFVLPTFWSCSRSTMTSKTSFAEHVTPSWTLAPYSGSTVTIE